MSRVLLTRGGAEKLRAELQRLKTVERPRVIEAIAEARSHGDLSENAEYEAAREEQGMLEGRILALENQLAQAEVIEPGSLVQESRVVFGATVQLYDSHGECEVTYQIVGDLEADLDQGQVSLSSPIARALIGREQGDEVEVHTPGGVRAYEILGIRYE